LVLFPGQLWSSYLHFPHSGEDRHMPPFLAMVVMETFCLASNCISPDVHLPSS
jgi:hypothetical protein